MLFLLGNYYGRPFLRRKKKVKKCFRIRTILNVTLVAHVKSIF